MGRAQTRNPTVGQVGPGSERNRIFWLRSKAASVLALPSSRAVAVLSTSPAAAMDPCETCCLCPCQCVHPGLRRLVRHGRVFAEVAQYLDTVELWRLDQLKELSGVFKNYSEETRLNLSLHPCPQAILSGKLEDIIHCFDELIEILKSRAVIRGVKNNFGLSVIHFIYNYGNEMYSKTMQLQMAAANGDMGLKEMHFENFGAQFHLNKECCLDFDMCVSLPKVVESAGYLRHLETIDVSTLLSLDPLPYLESLVWSISTWGGDRTFKYVEYDRNCNLFKAALKYFSKFPSLKFFTIRVESINFQKVDTARLEVPRGSEWMQLDKEWRPDPSPPSPHFLYSVIRYKKLPKAQPQWWSALQRPPSTAPLPVTPATPAACTSADPAACNVLPSVCDGKKDENADSVALQDSASEHEHSRAEERCQVPPWQPVDRSARAGHGVWRPVCPSALTESGVSTYPKAQHDHKNEVKRTKFSALRKSFLL